VKKFLLATLMIAALSGAVLVTHSSPAGRMAVGGSRATPTTANELNFAAARRTAPVPALRPLLSREDLIGNGDHPHPTPENAKLIDRVEGVRAAADLRHRERLALGRPHRPDRERYSIELRLHDAGHRAVPLRRAPDLRLRPGREPAQFLNLGLRVRRIVRQRQAAWVEGACVRAKGLEEARRFERQKTAAGAGPQRAIARGDGR
jgi:hypothetical protein